jgi:hypothetical protein
MMLLAVFPDGGKIRVSRPIINTRDEPHAKKGSKPLLGLSARQSW